MNKLDNIFTTYTFTDPELKEIYAALRSPVIAAFLQTRRAVIAMEKVSDKLDVNDRDSYYQQEAYKAGILFAYDQLLSYSPEDVELLEEEEESLHKEIL